MSLKPAEAPMIVGMALLVMFAVSAIFGNDVLTPTWASVLAMMVGGGTVAMKLRKGDGNDEPPSASA